MLKLKPVFALLALCALPLSAEAGETNLPSLALTPPAPPSLPSNGTSFSDDKFVLSGNAAAAPNLPAKPTSGVNATIGNVHVSLHMTGGAAVDSVIGR
jgi:hypothetical protein